MSTSHDRVLDGVDGALVEGSSSQEATVSVAVDPGEQPTLTVQTDGPGPASRTVTVDLSTDEARALGAALFRATTDTE